MDFGRLGNDLDQVQSYRTALISAGQSTSSLPRAGNLENSYQPIVPRPGTGVGVGVTTGSGVESGSMSVINSGRFSGRYDPFRDRNNVTHHKQSSHKLKVSTSGSAQQKSKVTNDSLGNNRQLSPNVDAGDEDENDDGDDSAWSVAKTGNRRRPRGNADLQRTKVTPIVIRRIILTDGEQDMEQGDDEMPTIPIVTPVAPGQIVAQTIFHTDWQPCC